MFFVIFNMTSWKCPGDFTMHASFQDVIKTFLGRFSKICEKMENINFLLAGGQYVQLYFKHVVVMSFIEWFETDICGTSLEGHNVNFTTGHFLHVLGTSLKNFVQMQKFLKNVLQNFAEYFPLYLYLYLYNVLSTDNIEKKAI